MTGALQAVEGWGEAGLWAHRLGQLDHSREIGEDCGNVAAKEGVLRVPLGFGFELGEEAHFASDVDCYGDAILVEHAVAGECGDARIG
jgi:hypothetical protein